MEKTIDLSLKAIKVIVEPYIGQTCNLVWWLQFFSDFALPIPTRVTHYLFTIMNTQKKGTF